MPNPVRAPIPPCFIASLNSAPPIKAIPAPIVKPTEELITPCVSVSRIIGLAISEVTLLIGCDKAPPSAPPKYDVPAPIAIEKNT